ANLHGTIFSNDLVGQPLGGLQLLCVEDLGREIDGAEVVAHVEGNGGEAVELFEGGREHMLSGMLLHVVTAAVGIDFATNWYPGLQPTGRAINKVQDAAGLLLLVNVDDPNPGAVCNPKDLAGIVVLAAAGGEES